MILRLDPRHPVLWRSPDSLQVGVDRALVIVPGVTVGLEAVVAALKVGVPRSAALMLGAQAGASAASITALLDLLGPVLVSEADAVAPAPRPGRPTVCVDGTGPTATRLRALLDGLGLADAAADEPAQLAVLVGHYTFDPACHGRWLRRDVPHLPVVFSDSAVHIGPMIEPGLGPCLTCLSLNRIDRDPAWPAMAYQLLGRTAPTETTRMSIDVAARVAGIVEDRLRSGHSELTETSLDLQECTGLVTRLEHRPNARCGCLSLPENVTVLAPRVAVAPTRTNSGQVLSGHE